VGQIFKHGFETVKLLEENIRAFILYMNDLLDVTTKSQATNAKINMECIKF
jgi:hypothetical protein